jgi:hypothetical protein
LQFLVFPDPGDGFFEKLGMTARVNVMFHRMHGLEWASHHPCAKWKGIFKANASCCQGHNQGFSVLLEWKQTTQQWTKRWAKLVRWQLGPLPFKQTVLGWSLEQQ